MTTCAFIGLGVMGRSMARNVLDAGFDLRVANRSPEPMVPLVAAGAVAAGSPAEAAAAADVVLICVSDAAAVEAVVLGADGVVDGARPGTIMVDHSTIDPATAERLAEECARRGVHALDAPVSGGEEGARDGTLSMMVGGDRSVLDRAMPVLGAMGTTVEHVGAAGAGQRVKAANQLLVAGIYSLVSEALLLVEEEGIETAAALRVLAGGLAGNRILEVRSESMHARTFAPGARIDLHRKDLAIVLDLARRAGIPLPVTAVVSQLYDAVAAQGGGDLDHSAVLTVIERLAGRDAPIHGPTAASTSDDPGSG